MADSAAHTAAGTKFYIGAALPTTYNKAGFEAVDWTEVGEITEIPEFGKKFNVVTHNPLGTRKTAKRKGSYNNGSIDIPYAYDADDDAGQVELIDAVDSDDSKPFWVEMGNGKSAYFTGQVTSAPITVGSVDSIIMGKSNIEIDDDVLLEDSPV